MKDRPDYEGVEHLISFLDIRVVALSQNIFGQITSASMRIQCRQLRKAVARDGRLDDYRVFRYISYFITREEAQEQWPGNGDAY